jgi:hypothetical protein
MSICKRNKLMDDPETIVEAEEAAAYPEDYAHVKGKTYYVVEQPRATGDIEAFKHAFIQFLATGHHTRLFEEVTALGQKMCRNQMRTNVKDSSVDESQGSWKSSANYTEGKGTLINTSAVGSVDDYVQEGMLRIWTTFADFEGDYRAFFAYCAKVFEFQVKSGVRDLQRERKRFAPFFLTNEDGATGENPEMHFEGVSSSGRYLTYGCDVVFPACLSREERVLLIYLAEEGQAATAVRYGLSVPTIKRRAAKLKQKLHAWRPWRVGRTERGPVPSTPRDLMLRRIHTTKRRHYQAYTRNVYAWVGSIGRDEPLPEYMGMAAD